MGELERLNKCNEMITVIATCGHKFFSHAGTVGHLELIKGRVYYFDPHSKKRIYAYPCGNWRQFTQGGTMRGVVIQMKAYIKEGLGLYSKTFGPWPKDYCGWGYSDQDQEVVRQAALRLGMLREVKPTPHPSTPKDPLDP